MTFDELRDSKLLDEETTVSFHGGDLPQDGFYISIPSMSWCSAGEYLTAEVAGGLWFEPYESILKSRNRSQWSAPAMPNGSSLLYAGHWTETHNGTRLHWLDVNVWLRDQPIPPKTRPMMLEFAK